jgi:hypothetical protein
MADAANVHEPARDAQGQNEAGKAPEHGGDNGNTSNSPESSETQSQNAQTTSNGDKQPKPKKPSAFKRIWGKLGLDIPTAILMFKLVPRASCPCGLSIVAVHLTDKNMKGLDRSHDRHSLVPDNCYFEAIHHHWLPCTNSRSPIHGEYDRLAV